MSDSVYVPDEVTLKTWNPNIPIGYLANEFFNEQCVWHFAPHSYKYMREPVGRRPGRATEGTTKSILHLTDSYA